jgi:hypothetical protein
LFLFFVLKLSSRIWMAEPAGLLPAQQDKESRGRKMKAKQTRRKGNTRKLISMGAGDFA